MLFLNTMNLPELTRLLSVILILFGLVACDDNRLVNERYGVVDQKSINGVDALKSTLEKRSELFMETVMVTRKAMREADLVVFVDRGGYVSEEIRRRVEAMLIGVELEDDLEVEDIENVHFESQNDGLLATPGRPHHYGDEPDDEQDAIKNKTFIFFLRDTDSSVPFYEKVLNDIKGHSDVERVIQKTLTRSKIKRRQADPDEIARNIFFGQRVMSNPGGTLKRSLIQDLEAIPTRVRAYPIRLRPLPAETLLKDQHFNVETLLTTYEGDDLIREFQFESHRLILIYNSEPFLNYGMVRSANRLLLKELLNYSLKNAPQKATINWVTQPFPNKGKLPRDVENPYKVLTAYPVNIVLVQLLLVLILFLLSRWPHERRPLPERIPGTREFLEHIKALGIHLKRARKNDAVIHALLRYKRKQGLAVPDPAEFIAAQTEVGNMKGKPLDSENKIQTDDAHKGSSSK